MLAGIVGLPVGVVGPIVSVVEPLIANAALPNVSTVVQNAINPVVDLLGTGTTTASIDPISIAEGNSGTTIVHVPVHLNAFPGNPVQLQYTTSDGTATARGHDYQATTGTVTFDPGETNAVADIPIIGDTRSRIRRDVHRHALEPGQRLHRYPVGDRHDLSTDEARMTGRLVVGARRRHGTRSR